MSVMLEQAPKIVIIGLGFLMRYMKTCFQTLTGEAYPQNVVATTNTATTIEAKQQNWKKQRQILISTCQSLQICPDAGGKLAKADLQIGGRSHCRPKKGGGCAAPSLILT